MQPGNNVPNSAPNNVPGSTPGGALESAPAVPQTEVTAVETVEVQENMPMNETPKRENVFQNSPKKSNGMLIGLILCLIAAVAGIGFGVWMMIDGNTQKEQLNAQINSLKASNSTLQEQVDELQAKVDIYESMSGGDVYEILPPVWGEAEAVVENNYFAIKNGQGEVYLQWTEQAIDEIVSCDSGTSEDPLPLTCVVKTPNGEAKFIYDFDEHSLEFVE